MLSHACMTVTGSFPPAHHLVKCFVHIELHTLPTSKRLTPHMQLMLRPAAFTLAKRDSPAIKRWKDQAGSQGIAEYLNHYPQLQN